VETFVHLRAINNFFKKREGGIVGSYAATMSSALWRAVPP